MIAPTTALRQRLDRLRHDRDRGTSLLELVVGMSLMSIFMAIFTAAMISMFTATSKIQTVSNSSAQLDTAFDRLDKQVRYAATIDAPIAPTATTAYWSVAFQTVDPTQASATTCTQLRAYGASDPTRPQQLAERTWPVTVNADGSTSAGAISGWSQLASGITNGGVALGSADQPFTLLSIVGATVQQLHLRLIDSNGTGTSATTSVSEITFTALNSAATTNAIANSLNSSACSQTGTL